MENEVKKDWRIEDVNHLKTRMNKWRGIFVNVFIVALIPTLYYKIFEHPVFSLKVYYIFYWTFFSSLAGWYLTHAFKIIKAWESGAPFLLGIAMNPWKSGPAFVFWPFMKIVFVQIWQRELDIPKQKVITKDGVADVDGLLIWKILNVKKFIINIKEAEKVLIDLALAAFRSAAGTRTTDGLKDDSKKISEETTQYLNDLTRQKDWGIEVVSAQLTRVDPPDEVAKAMEELASTKKKAEAVVEKAKGDAQGVKVAADAAAYDIEKRAEGQAKGWKALIEVLGETTPEKTLVALKALEAIQKGEKIYLSSDIAGVKTIADVLSGKS